MGQLLPPPLGPTGVNSVNTHICQADEYLTPFRVPKGRKLFKTHEICSILSFDFCEKK